MQSLIPALIHRMVGIVLGFEFFHMFLWLYYISIDSTRPCLLGRQFVLAERWAKYLGYMADRRQGGVRGIQGADFIGNREVVVQFHSPALFRG